MESRSFSLKPVDFTVCAVRPLTVEQGAGIETCYGLDGSGFEPWWGQAIYFSPHVSKPALGPSQPPVEWARGLFSRGLSGRGVVWTPPPYSAEVNNK
jgi:hypothetical protein